MRNINQKYFDVLSQRYPTIQSICHEMIHLKAILNLPKGTEHYISDLHGEYNAFKHLMNNCSGVIKEKALFLFQNEMSVEELNEFCFLIYYPEKTLKTAHVGIWYRQQILRLIRLSRYVTSKYTRTRVRRHIESEYADIIDELLHAQLDELDQQYIYHLQIIDSIIELEEQDDFIKILTQLIKYFAIDQLHILGDIYDRGKGPDKIIDDLIRYERVDIQWGNHDILWMGAYLGQEACLITVVKNCIHYHNTDLLEKGYGIPLRQLMMTAMNQYRDQSQYDAMEKYCLDLQMKLEAQLIKKYPYLHMHYRITNHNYSILTEEDIKIILDFKRSFMKSARLKKHMQFLFQHGSLYLRTNHNLLLHGCIPLDEHGEFYEHVCFQKKVKGKAYFDLVNEHIQIAFLYKDQESIDYLWYLWCGDKSPLCGRKIVLDHPQEEIKDHYYQYIHQKDICQKILHEFHLYEEECMIINGHTPVRVKDGETPLLKHRKLVIIDGGFCIQNQKKTGVAGYTLISNSHGMRLKTHHIHEGAYTDYDTEYDSEIIYTRKNQEMVKDTRQGEFIQEQIEDLKELLQLKKQSCHV